MYVRFMRVILNEVCIAECVGKRTHAETPASTEQSVENKGTGAPPLWLKPNDLLRLRRAGKRRLQPRALQPVDLNTENAAADVRKRDCVINPFR